jgi:hypothetical protein
MNELSNTPQSQTYQGWSNYPTWAVNLWLANDEPLYRRAMDMARAITVHVSVDSNVLDGTWTPEDAQKFRLADAYQDWVREMVEMDEASMRSDLLGYALDMVNWDELAVSWLRDYRETT